MWETIQYVGSPIALVAFGIAAFATVYRFKLRQQVALLERLPEYERASFISRSLESYQMEHDNLTRKQKFDLVHTVLEHRIRRLKIAAIASVVIIVIVAVSVVLSFLATRNTPDAVINKQEAAHINKQEAALELLRKLNAVDNTEDAEGSLAEIAAILVQVQKTGEMESVKGVLTHRAASETPPYTSQQLSNAVAKFEGAVVAFRQSPNVDDAAHI